MRCWAALILCVALVHCAHPEDDTAPAEARDDAKPAPPPPNPPAGDQAIDENGRLSETTRKKLLAEINKYRLMHDATPVGYCLACVDMAQDWVNKIAASGDIKSDHTSKYGQTVFSTKDPEATVQGPDYFGTLIAATWYNQIKNYDFVKNEFKGNADDFSQLVWEGSEVVGFASAKGTDGTIYVIAYYNPGGNNETMNFYENVNRVTGAGDIEGCSACSQAIKTKCPEGWGANGQNCFKLFNSEMTWSDAVDHCNVLKSSLVSAETPEEGMYVRSLLAEKEKGSWLGMSDTAMKGGFQFVDGTPYVYSDWSYDSYTWLYAHPMDARSKCITASKNGWAYNDCSAKLPFVCKMRPNGVLSFSVDLYFPGSTFTNDLAQLDSRRYTTLKEQIDKAFNQSYGSDIWFVGSTFYQFMPRDNGEVAASTLLKFAPDVRAPVDPITKLREYLRSQNEVKILAVRLIPGVGRVSTPVMTAGTCPSGCSGDCYPECNPGCCGAAVSLAAPAIPSGYTACPQYAGCSQSCQPVCSQQCCQANQMPAPPPVIQLQVQMPAPPQIQMMPAPQQCAAQCAPTFSPQCCQQAPPPACAPQCAPSFAPSCCAAPPPPPPMMMAAPQCSPQCAPAYAPSCCQAAAPPPMMMAANPCAAMAPQCSAACAPACRSSCCRAKATYRNVIGKKNSRSKISKKAKKHQKKHDKKHA